jgi:hypothetical protein
LASWFLETALHDHTGALQGFLARNIRLGWRSDIPLVDLFSRSAAECL